MIRIIEHALKECITKSMLRSYRPIELFYQNKFSESDGVPRKTWQVINELTSRKTGRSSVRELSLNGVSITNSTALSNAFNYHFSTIGSKLASEIPYNNGSSLQEYISGLSERFQLVSTDSNQVLSLFKKLNKSKDLKELGRWNI